MKKQAKSSQHIETYLILELGVSFRLYENSIQEPFNIPEWNLVVHHI